MIFKAKDIIELNGRFFFFFLFFFCFLVFGLSMKKRASLAAQKVKNPPAMQKIWVQSLGKEHPLEEGMATHSSILRASLVAQMIKNLPAMQETWVRCLGREDLLE